VNKRNQNSDNIRWLTKGDMVAFDAVYELYCRRLFGFVIRYIKHREDAEEIVQDVFVKIWENRNRIDTFSSFDAYIFTIAYNTTIDLLRKRVCESKYFDYLVYRQQIEMAPDVTDEIGFKELSERADLLVNRLTPRQREVFFLCRKEGLSHEEIAHRLHISVNTVKNHMVSALAFIKSHLDDSLAVNILFFYLFL
jgi:RNA polymerase sigma-70 factor, ECF subfamily